MGAVSVKMLGEELSSVSHALPYLALLTIEASNDRKDKIMTPADLQKAVLMYINLPDPIIEEPVTGDSAAAQGFLLRIGQTQLAHQTPLFHLFSRTKLLFDELWAGAQLGGVPIQARLADISGGLSIEQILATGLIFAGLSLRDSTVRVQDPFTQQALRKYGQRMQELVSAQSQLSFFKWLSADYRAICEAARQLPIPAGGHRHHRVNPLVSYPMVRPTVNADPRPVAIVPYIRFLMERFTRGLYYELATRYQGEGGGNAFKNEFGLVLEKYVLKLVREALPAASVLGDWEYGPKAKRQRTPDCIVVEGDRVTVIEVKQSALTRDAKSWGNIGEAKKALKSTLAKAVKQFVTFESDLRDGKVAHEQLTGKKDFERLIVTHDTIHWTNTVIRELAAEIAEELKVSPVPHFHVATLDDFEHFLAYAPGESMFALLRRKRDASEEAMFDFRNWLLSLRASEGLKKNERLAAMYVDMVTGWGVDPGDFASPDELGPCVAPW